MALFIEKVDFYSTWETRPCALLEKKSRSEFSVGSFLELCFQFYSSLGRTKKKKAVRLVCSAFGLIRQPKKMQASTLRWWLVGAEDEREKAPASLYFMLTVIDSFAKGQEEEGRGGN